MTSPPAATYRLQLTPEFGFRAVAEIIPYLHELGITHVYASPVFTPRKGSTHGYDVIDPVALNPALGTVRDLGEVRAALEARSMGWIQDIVPNHMAFDSANRMLMDVLEHGPSSPFAAVFDIDWDHPYENMRGKVLAPFLGRFYGECLEAGEIRLDYEEQGFVIRYYDWTLPLKSESYVRILRHFPGEGTPLPGGDPDAVKFQGVITTLMNLPDPGRPKERREQLAFAKHILWELASSREEVRAYLTRSVAAFNGRPGEPDSFNLLEELLEEQYYRLSFWKVATEEINYRRFFNINQLISVRVEDPAVFDLTHAGVLEHLASGVFDGLRVDHIDGLFDPLAYLSTLRSRTGPAYLTVEKILEPEETLPAAWPVEGTTGYDFLNVVNGLFCERKHEKRFEKIYERFIGRRIQYDELVADTKRLMIGRHMAGDVDRLAHLIKGITSHDRHAGDITMYGLRRAVVELLSLFPVYRTYIDSTAVDETDASVIREAARRARGTNPALVLELDFLERFLLLQFTPHLGAGGQRSWLSAVMRFQQLTGPLMAKGFEDTALFRYACLVSLNEVGGAPRRFGVSPLEFHHFNRRRGAAWPHTMNTTATHDTKRGEDARMRITTLSELPDEWHRHCLHWKRLNRPYKTVDGGREIPDPNDEYMLYQTLIGTYPPPEEESPGYLPRLKEYLTKAVREAKVHTAWLRPDERYESAFLAFVDRILAPGEGNQFLKDFLPFQERVAFQALVHSLAQTLLKVTCPGVPDVYQGTEFWDYSFVDPDNRRTVDYGRRMEVLRTIASQAGRDSGELMRSLLASPADGRVKLFVLWKALRERRRSAGLFATGEYLPLRVTGRHRNHVVAFARRLDSGWAVVLVPRRTASLAPTGGMPLGEEIWQETWVVLPEEAPGRWQDVFSAQTVGSEGGFRVADLLEHFPVAFLISA